MERLRIIGVIVFGKGSQFFTLDQVVEVSGFDRMTVRRALEKLIREKLILTISKKDAYQLKASLPVDLGKGRPSLAITYRIADKKGLVERVTPKMKEGTAQDRMWTAMRYKSHADRTFSVAEIVRLANVNKEHARWFFKSLRRAGIVQPSKKGGPGVEWILIKDVGPRRPYVGKARIAHSA